MDLRSRAAVFGGGSGQREVRRVSYELPAGVGPLTFVHAQ